MPPQPTSNGTRRLSEVARHLVIPSGIVSTGWPAVRDKCRDLGIGFDGWQDGAGRLILALRANGKLAVMVGGVGMSLPRQVGKTYLLGALCFALAILRPGLLIIWTSHHLRTSNETFLTMQGFARRRKIAPYVENVYKGSGDEAVIFRNGSRILFGARERGFGRGIPGVDVLMCDEAQILTERALDNMLATLNTSKLGLVVYMGTPPRPEDPSEAFTRMRAEALSGEDTDSVWIECGADPDASPADRKQWAKGNPSFPHRTPVESLLRLRKKLSAESFRREGLGIWDEVSVGLIDPVAFAACMVSDRPRPDTTPVFFADASPGLRSSALGIAAADDAGLFVDEEHGPGTRWLLERAAEFNKQFPDAAWFYESTSAAGALVPAFAELGIELQTLTGPDMGRACANLQQLVLDKAIQICADDALTAALAGAVKRDVGDGLWAWGRRKSSTDIAPLVAITGAAWAWVSAMSNRSEPWLAWQ